MFNKYTYHVRSTDIYRKYSKWPRSCRVRLQKNLVSINESTYNIFFLTNARNQYQFPTTAREISGLFYYLQRGISRGFYIVCSGKYQALFLLYTTDDIERFFLLSTANDISRARISCSFDENGDIFLSSGEMKPRVGRRLFAAAAAHRSTAVGEILNTDARQKI